MWPDRRSGSDADNVGNGFRLKLNLASAKTCTKHKTHKKEQSYQYNQPVCRNLLVFPECRQNGQNQTSQND